MQNITKLDGAVMRWSNAFETNTASQKYAASLSTFSDISLAKNIAKCDQKRVCVVNENIKTPLPGFVAFSYQSK